MNVKTPPDSHLWNILDGDPYTCRLCPGNRGYRYPGAHYRMVLRTVPDNIVEFMTSRIPNLKPFDWWWIWKGDKIEIAIREEKVLEIKG